MKDFLWGSEQTGNRSATFPELSGKKRKGEKGREIERWNLKNKRTGRSHTERNIKGEWGEERAGGIQREEMEAESMSEQESPKADCSFYINGFQLIDCLQYFRWVKLEIKEIRALITLPSTDWIFRCSCGVISSRLDQVCHTYTLLTSVFRCYIWVKTFLELYRDTVLG